jgi:predicted DNA binding protein
VGAIHKGYEDSHPERSVALIVEFSVASEAFPLGQAVARSGVSVELEAVVPATAELLPFLWTRGGDPERFTAVAEADPAVESVRPLDVVGDATLHRVRWSERAGGLFAAVEATGATVLEAHGGRRWAFRVRFDDSGELSTFSTRCREAGVSVRLGRVYSQADVRDDPASRFGLTAAQREALVVAVDRGYFTVPRGATLGDIAATLGITEQAASERIRRGTDAVLASVLVGGERGAAAAEDGDSLERHEWSG